MSMKQKPVIEQLERNLASKQRHSHEVLWQIMFPLTISALIVIAISVLSVGLGAVDASRWGSISLIWLIVPIMLAVLIGFLLLIAIIVATSKIIEVIPRGAFQLSKVFTQLDMIARDAGNRITEPVIRTQTLSAAFMSLRRQIPRIRIAKNQSSNGEEGSNPPLN